MSAADDLMLLGLLPTASAIEVKAAYRRRALELHPDRGGDQAAFAALAAAYKRLSQSAPTITRGGRCSTCRGTGIVLTHRGFHTLRTVCPVCRIKR